MSPLSPETRLALPPQVVARTVDDTLALLDTDSGAYFTINDVGARFVESVQAGRTLAESATAVAEEYDVSAEQALADLTELADELLREGLLQASVPEAD